jgi:competence protein ComEC
VTDKHHRAGLYLCERGIGGPVAAVRRDALRMTQWMFCMALGIGVVACLPALPAPATIGAVFTVALVATLASLRRPSRSRCRKLSFNLLALVAGVIWGIGYGYLLRGELLPLALEQEPLLLTGRIEGLVEGYADAPATGARPTLRWTLRVEHCERPSSGQCDVALRRVRLTAYDLAGSSDDHALRPAAGELWQLRVRLKRPRGFANPGGFDFESWLVAQRVSATGVVEQAAANRRLEPAPPWSVDRWRGQVQRRLDQRAPALVHVDLLAGLVIGDGSRIAAASWDTFRTTGTVHLFVVSGLQIAFTGGLALAAARLWWRSPWGRSRRRDYWLGIAPAFLLAAGYAQLAGGGLPIQRALIMFGCFLWALARRREGAVHAWQLALLLVLLGNPLAVLEAGFWFSFGAVAAILIALRTRTGERGTVKVWWRVQCALFVAALPLLLATDGQFTLLALPANALAVPWSTLLTMPLAFAALLCEAVRPDWAGALWLLADLTLRALWFYLCWLQQWSEFATWRPAGIQPPGIACAVLSAALYLLPRGLPGRGWAWLFLLPVAWPQLDRIAPGDCRLTVIDVGQGLSVLVETTRHRLLYDTGPPFGPQRTVAEFTVAPLLRRRGIARLDAVAVSHADSDHAGGWPTMAAQFRVGRLLLGEDLPAAAPLPTALPPLFCRAGQKWYWDDVEFSILHPTDVGHARHLQGNNRSCVLRINARGATILLPGDIERTAEYALHDRLAPVDILLAPHHGSRTSSTETFIARVRPRHVVFSTGYRNRFAHPHSSVVERYAQAGAQLLDTADSGAITFDIQGGRVMRIEQWRRVHTRYW